MMKPEWWTSTVEALARGILEDGGWARLPALADAMEMAGYTGSFTLDVLRGLVSRVLTETDMGPSGQLLSLERPIYPSDRPGRRWEYLSCLEYAQRLVREWQLKYDPAERDRADTENLLVEWFGGPVPR